MSVIGFALFFLAGLGFGYAAPGKMKLVPVIFPVILAAGAIARDGFQGEILGRLAAAVALTLLGCFLGWMIDQRSQREEAAAH